MATFNRVDLKVKVLENSDFRQFLELDSGFRDIISCFYEGKYTECLELLYQRKVSWIYNYFVADQITELLKLFRVKMILQYLEPFSTADITKMAPIFRCNAEELIMELVNLIESKILIAKIDSIQKVCSQMK